MRIPFARAPLTYDEVAPYLKEALDNGWLTTGPLVQKFSEGVSAFLETAHLVAVSSCTAALQIALAAADFNPGDEILLPANTFIATFETVELAGLRPVLCDIDANTWNLDPESAANHITARTKGIIAVPFAGNPLPMDAWRNFCAEHKLKLILDNAHALETRWHDQPLHNFADFSCYSFYATKNLTTAEGGAIIAPTGVVDRVRALSLHGMSRAAWNRYAGGTWRYDIVETGFKANLTDIHAALGLAQLPHLEAYHRRRAEIAHQYQQGLAGLPLRTQQLPPGAKHEDHAWHLFCISFTGKDAASSREKAMAAFTAAGIGFSVHFIPIFEFTNTRNKYRFEPRDFPHTNAYFEGALSLPIYPTLSDSEQAEIISALRNVFRDT